jgi:hypothetical protein
MRPPQLIAFGAAGHDPFKLLVANEDIYSASTDRYTIAGCECVDPDHAGGHTFLYDEPCL